jgi:hypothetical protein
MFDDGQTDISVGQGKMKSELPPWEKPQTPLKKIFRAIGLLIAQSIIAWLLFSELASVFFIPAESWGNNESLLVIQEIARAIIYTFSVFLVIQLLDDRSITSLGLQFDRRALIDLLAGILITGIVLGTSFLIFLGFGWIKVTGFVWQEHSMSSVLLYVLGTSLLFAYAYLKTGPLWLSIGLHAGWDFFVVVVFYGSPIGNLNIFHLMDLGVRSSLSQVVFSIAEFIELTVCFVLVRVYITARNKKQPAIQCDANLSTAQNQSCYGLPS